MSDAPISPPDAAQIAWARAQGYVLSRTGAGGAEELLVYDAGDGLGGCLDEVGQFLYVNPETQSDPARWRALHAALKAAWEA
ncbi:hypothetical protein [Magnetofaba australis]|nr:hypothetical protein [Magnetofaba australis]